MLLALEGKIVDPENCNAVLNLKVIHVNYHQEEVLIDELTKTHQAKRE